MKVRGAAQEKGANTVQAGGSRDAESGSWLIILLGVAPYLLGTALLAGVQGPEAEKDAKLWRRRAWSRWRVRLAERRFGRVQVGVDRAERRTATAYLKLVRVISREEAARLVHAEGYRLLGERWGGYFAETPKLIAAVTDSAPGVLPSVSESDRERHAVAADHLVHGGPVRRALEREFGNPLAEKVRGAHERRTTESLLSEFAQAASKNGPEPRPGASEEAGPR